MMIRKLTLSSIAGVLTFVATSPVAPPTVAAERDVARTTRVAPASIERLRLDAPMARGDATTALDPSLLRSRAHSRCWYGSSRPPLPNQASRIRPTRSCAANRSGSNRTRS